MQSGKIILLVGHLLNAVDLQALVGRRDNHFVEKVADDFMTVCRNTDPLTVTGECADHASASVCLPRSRWALDRKNAMVQIESDPHSSRQRRLAIALEHLSPKSRCVCHQKIARGAMIPFAFHPIIGHVFSEPKKGLSLLIVVKRFMGKDRLRMEIGRVAALLDIDRPIIVRNGDDSSVVSSSDAPKFALRSDIGILQLEFVAMDGRLGGATSLLKEH